MLQYRLFWLKRSWILQADPMINRLFFLQILANLCRSNENLQIWKCRYNLWGHFLYLQIWKCRSKCPTSRLCIFKFADPISVPTKQSFLQNLANLCRSIVDLQIWKCRSNLCGHLLCLKIWKCRSKCCHKLSLHFQICRSNKCPHKAVLIYRTLLYI